MKVLFVTPELAPLTSIGGIGEGLGALARALARRGDDVTVVLPRFADAGAALSLSRRPLGLSLRGDDDVSVLEGSLAPRLEIALVDSPFLARRPHVYGPDTRDAANASRFALFSRAVVALVREHARAGRSFAVVHCHEWPCAAVPYLLRVSASPSPHPHPPPLAASDIAAAPPRTVLSLHNLAFQGIFDAAVLPELGLAPEHAALGALGVASPEGRYVNFLRGGILAADALTTVSPTYAREIVRPGMGEGLEDALVSRKGALTGLLNGIDHDVWNPATDAALPARYTAGNLRGKGVCKAALLEELGLTEHARERPLLVSAGRIVRQKGSDLLATALPALVDAGVTVVVAGSGEEPLADELRRAAASRPDHARFLGFVQDDLLHRLLAAADLVAMPSRFEPCGIVQMYAHRYGAIPVARRTGGLADTITPVTPGLAAGSGFLFDPPTEGALIAAVTEAAAAVRSPTWTALQARAMDIDHGWTRRSAAYASLYRKLAPPAPRA